jgi:hypothetical protein
MKRQDNEIDEHFAKLIGRSLHDLPDVPEWASQRALNAWKAPATAKLGFVNQIGRALARITFDSWAQLSAGAVPVLRSGSQTRQLLFSFEDHDIDLRISQEPTGNFVLTGQILGPVDHGQVHWFESGDVVVRESALVDDGGEFLIANLQPGRGVLSFEINGSQFESPEFNLTVESSAV